MRRGKLLHLEAGLITMIIQGQVILYHGRSDLSNEVLSMEICQWRKLL